MSKTWDVRAVRWEHGWELHIAGLGVTQCRTLDGADRMVRDYAESLTADSADGDEVSVTVDLGGLERDAVQPWLEAGWRT